MTEHEREYRGELVKLGRHARRMTQKQLADAIGVTQALISLIEEGQRTITTEVAAALADALQFPVAFFAQPDPVTGPGLGEIYHRRKKSISAKDLETSYAWLNIRAFTARRLLEAVDWPDVDVPIMSLDLDVGDEEEAAQFLRARWNVPTGPIRSVSQVLDRAGVLVMPETFTSAEMDGVSLWLGDLPPMMLVNRDIPQDRLRFTMAHELGHLVLHLRSIPRSFDDGIEREAHAFAGAFLLPRAEIRPQLRNLTIEKLAQLKRHWRVSMAALLMRAKQLETITPAEERKLWMQLSANGWRKREPIQLDVTGETPGGLFRQVVDLHTGDLGYSPEQMGRMLNLPEADIERHVLFPRGSLRAVL